MKLTITFISQHLRGGHILSWFTQNWNYNVYNYIPSEICHACSPISSVSPHVLWSCFPYLSYTPAKKRFSRIRISKSNILHQVSACINFQTDLALIVTGHPTNPSRIHHELKFIRNLPLNYLEKLEPMDQPTISYFVWTYSDKSHFTAYWEQNKSCRAKKLSFSLCSRHCLVISLSNDLISVHEFEFFDMIPYLPCFLTLKE